MKPTSTIPRPALQKHRQHSSCGLFSLRFAMARCLVVILLSFFLLLPPLPAAEPSQLIPFQGTLVDRAGTVFANGPYAITFILYGDATGGPYLWSERHEKVAVRDSKFDVVLGSINPFLPKHWSNHVNFGATRYLGLTIDADGNPSTPDKEISPRHLLLTNFHPHNNEPPDPSGWDGLLGGQNSTDSIIQLTGIPDMTPGTSPAVPRTSLDAAKAEDSLVTSYNPEHMALLQAGYKKIGSAEMREAGRAASTPPPPRTLYLYQKPAP